MPRVDTSYGAVEGLQRHGHVSFLGVPYGAPPKGERRFRAPAPPAAWTGVRQAATPGFASPQSSHPIPGFAASGPQDEDCLYLNVYTPAADAGRRPMLFWIHGGAFTHGSSTEALYDGGPLACRGDVVVVSINYRLGALGYLYLGDRLPGMGLTANAGQLDQVAALRWVHDNIAAFGGDPGNVTIFGESAGAAAVGTLLAMPSAQGLFHRAVLQSGTGRANDREGAARTVDRVLAELGVQPSQAARLLELPAADIVQAQSAAAAKAVREGEPALLFGPVRDGETLTQSPLEAIRAGVAAGIPVMLGTNRDEVKLFAASTRREPIDDARLGVAVKASLPKASEGDASALIEVYRRSRGVRNLPTSNLDILDAIQTDTRFRIPATRLALAQREHQPDTYLYLFTHESPARHGALGACHALEMPFVFGTLKAPTQDLFAGSGPELDQLSEDMMDAWLSFAKSDEPSHDGIGEWPPYDAVHRTTMVFHSNTHCEVDPFGEERAAIEPLV